MQQSLKLEVMMRVLNQYVLRYPKGFILCQNQYYYLYSTDRPID